MKVLQPPCSLNLPATCKSVFLAGSIEMDTAEQWQSMVTNSLEDTDITILNPRRDSWDASWQQSIDNPVFREQVEWELTGQDLATTIAMYFDPATKAPITLLELGLFAQTGKLVVCCPDGFWRKGNVDIVCDRHQIPMVNELQSLIDAVRRRCT